jgi:putative nucleotidyltransferase with HDIG domain
MIAALRGAGIARAAALVATVVFAGIVLMVGRPTAEPPVLLVEGDPAPETFIATSPVVVVDQTETQALRDAASTAVPDVYQTDSQATQTVLDSISRFFEDVRAAAQPLIIDVDDPETITPSTDPTTTTSEDTTTTDGSTASEGTTSSTSSTTTTTQPTTTTTQPAEPAPRETQIQLLQLNYPLFSTETIVSLVDLVNDDLYVRAEAGEPQFFSIVEAEAIDTAEEFLLDGIRTTELESIRTSLVADPRPIVLLRLDDDDQRSLIEGAVAEVVALSLQANELKDDAATQLERLAAADTVEDVVIEFVQGEEIVRVNERMTAVQIEAITQLGLVSQSEEIAPVRALFVVTVITIMVATLYLWRIGHDFWGRPKMVALFGLLVVLAAGAARVPELVNADEVAIGFLLPAALIGYLGASLFDARLAVVLALPTTVFTALATGDIALAIFAAAATLMPVPLVSSVASRAQLNTAVVISAAIHVPLTMGLAWFFYGRDEMIVAAIWGFVSGIASGVVALGVLPILSTVFGITTTQTLLDLTDRNHPALRRIEDLAPGTFNHSIMVGNLADRAARSVGANPLLARAMAYFHDLGKTNDPKYFVENQFGVTNPHDRLPPEESATIIRSHVSEGLTLAREYRIPPDVAQGILTHHGTSLMRFFYHKAEGIHGADLRPSDYRHRGRKPRSKEMVILMLADATEASTRALVQHEDPTSEKIRELVENVIAEKVEDGQLEESDVTFGELTRIKEAFVDALIGYYHTRIPYPNFPSAGGDRTS